VLFADLKGSMELLADRDPEEARKLLDPVLERMMEAVHRYEGTVNQVMGDGIMALFGAPLAHEDHAVRACYAALRMQEAVKRYGDDVRRTEGVSVRIRVGLNSGEVVVRAIGSDLHMDYTAVGQTTNLAARMEQLADPGTALVAPATLTLAEDFVSVRSLGLTPVKGVSEPVHVYELTGANPTRSRFHAHAARGLTKFVGRSSELAQLAEALDLARGGRGQVVAVVGEAGVGKSRLFWEFAHSHRTDGCLVIEAASVSYGKATTYFPVIDLLRGYFQVEPRDDLRKIREKVTGKLFSLDRMLDPTLPALLALLDVPVEDEEWTRLDPPQRRHRTLDAVKRLLLRESHVQPLVVIFEDLHWIDGETQAVLDGLAESLPTARMLLLVNYRPEYQPPWGRKTYYRQVRIDALPSASAEELLRALLGSDPKLAPLERLLIERTEGNPFFLEESVRTLVETRVLEGAPGTYRLTGAPAGLQVPATAQAILAARIDRLPLEEKSLLQTAAVIGKDVPFALIQALADRPEHELQRDLTHLQTAEFLYETRLFPELEYTFKHALTQEVAYGSLLQDRRRALHTQIVQAVERLYPDRVSEHAEQLAHHAVRAAAWVPALAYTRQAAAKAAARSAIREEVACLEQALTALAHLPERRDTLEAAIDTRLELRFALFQLAQFDEQLEHLREAERLAETAKDRHQLARVLVALCHYYTMTGDQYRAIDAGQRAHALAASVGDRINEARARSTLAQAYYARGEYRRSVELLRGSLTLEGELIAHGAADLSPAQRASFRNWFAWSLAETGAFPEGLAVGEEGVQLAQDKPFAVINALFGVSLVHVLKGDFEQAIVRLERALGLCRFWQIPIPLVLVTSQLGYAYALSGRLAEAIPLLEESVELSKGRWGGSQRMAWLAESHLLAGRAHEALELARQALELARAHKERGHEAWTLRLLGETGALSDAPDADAAGGHYWQALALATELEMHPLVAHCHLGLGKLYRRTGARAKSEEHLTTARAMYREMDMGFYLAQAEAAGGGGEP
jgi:predicted ATPase/class 3 adenylate cyclase